MNSGPLLGTWKNIILKQGVQIITMSTAHCTHNKDAPASQRPNHYGLMLLFRSREEYDKASLLSNLRRSRDTSLNHLRESKLEKFLGIEEQESE